MRKVIDSMEIVHKFEVAKLGVAPFRCVGSFIDEGPKKWIEDGVQCESGSPGQAMGSCDYCGQGIKLCFRIKGTCGSVFVVGSSCVEKTSAKGTRIYNDVERVMLEHRRKLRHAREDRKIEELKALLKTPDSREKISQSPHPHKWRSDLGENLLDFGEWTMSNPNCGAAIRLKCLKLVKKALRSNQY